jgi:hypothetical protein
VAFIWIAIAITSIRRAIPASPTACAPNTRPSFLSNNNPSSIQYASDLPGYRVWAGVANGSGLNALPTEGIRYASIPYNHSWNITTTNGGYNATGELQVYNGKYVTKGVAGSYANYSSYNRPTTGGTYVQPNYSGISSSGYRYANFVWLCPPLSGQYLFVKFTIVGLTQNIPNINTADSINFTQNSTNYNMNVYFRIEDNMTTYTLEQSNTTWINATKTNSLGGSTHLDTTKVLGGKNASLINTCSGSGNDYTLTIYSQIPAINNSSTTSVYLYARVELPMAANIGFSYITARLDKQSLE